MQEEQVSRDLLIPIRTGPLDLKSASDPGTAKLSDSHDGPPGQKCPRGRCVKKEEDQNQGLDLETAARHQCRNPYEAVQGSTVAAASLLGAKMCTDKSWKGSRGGGEEHYTGQEPEG